MTKRLRNEEEERESPSCWPPETKRRTRNDDDVGEDILAWLMVDEDGGAGGEDFFCHAGSDEVAELLAGAEKSDAGARTAANRSAAMAAGSVIQTASSSYVTINGNDETCGSSFSDLDSSVMASVDIGGLGCRGFDPEPPPPADLDGGGFVGEACVDCGFDWDGDDGSLARFIDEVFSEQGSLA